MVRDTVPFGSMAQTKLSNKRKTIVLFPWLGWNCIGSNYDLQNWGAVPIIKTIAGNWYRYDAMPAYFMSVLLFIAFLNLQITGSGMKKLIAIVAPTTFCVYLIHMHADFSGWLWEVINMPQLMSKCGFPFVHLFIVLAIFGFCSLIDFIRINTIGKIEKSVFFQNRCVRVQRWLNLE